MWRLNHFPFGLVYLQLSFSLSVPSEMECHILFAPAETDSTLCRSHIFISITSFKLVHGGWPPLVLIKNEFDCFEKQNWEILLHIGASDFIREFRHFYWKCLSFSLRIHTRAHSQCHLLFLFDSSLSQILCTFHLVRMMGITSV